MLPCRMCFELLFRQKDDKLVFKTLRVFAGKVILPEMVFQIRIVTVIDVAMRGTATAKEALFVGRMHVLIQLIFSIEPFMAKPAFWVAFKSRFCEWSIEVTLSHVPFQPWLIVCQLLRNKHLSAFQTDFAELTLVR